MPRRVACGIEGEVTMPSGPKSCDTGWRPPDSPLLSVDQPDPVHSVLPHSCRLLGARLMLELDAFAAVSRQEPSRFGPWLQKRIEAGLSPGGPVEDAIRLEMAIFDARAAAQNGVAAIGRRIVLLRYEPDELLDPTIPAEELQPVPSGVTVVIDTTDRQLSVRRIDDRLHGRMA
jgi:hypothetical protein